ncbi:hypothetical protein EDD86DRAFT_205953 [Gorgonomyces haynaldii]|nr:hypothetical protein EDD86DRAFT_205953 [Gorgonomyces haynaldii]
MVESSVGCIDCWLSLCGLKSSWLLIVKRKFSQVPEMPSIEQQKLAHAICEFLNQSIQSKTIDNEEGIEVAVQVIAESFGITVGDPQYSIKPASLQTIFDVFTKTQQQAKPKSGAEAKAKAELLKQEGNKKLASKDYDGAIKAYTDAIQLHEDAVFYANRAAAHSQKGQHAPAVQDAKRAIELDPGYSKAHSRLGHALFGLGNYKEAVEAYENGLKLEPTNQSMKQSLAAAQQKAGIVSEKAAPQTPDLASMMANPNLMNMAADMMKNNPGLANMFAGQGGAPDIGSLMNNPAIMNMASQMMQDPQMAAMYSYSH